MRYNVYGESDAVLDLENAGLERLRVVIVRCADRAGIFRPQR